MMYNSLHHHDTLPTRLIVDHNHAVTKHSIINLIISTFKSYYLTIHRVLEIVRDLRVPIYLRQVFIVKKRKNEKSFKLKSGRQLVIACDAS